MGLFSFLRKNKQEPASDTGEFYSRAEENTKPARGRRSRTEGNPDAALPERKRARRRLIGAFALVLAAVIGLPMILDSEPQSVGNDITIEIPSKDKSEPPSVRRVEPPVYPTPGVGAEQAQPTPAVTQPASPEVTAPVAAGNTDKTETQPSKGKAEAASAKAQAAASRPESKPSSAPANKPDEARALALLDGKSGEKPAAEKSASVKTGGSYAVQVAALSGKAKVAELRAKLKHAGIQSYTQDVATDSGERTRVRVGPFNSKEDADKMLKRLAKLGLKNGTIVAGSH